MAEKFVSVSALRELLSIPPDGDCEKCEHHGWGACYNDHLVRACEAIDDAPEADVRPVVRADLIIVKHGINPFSRIKCSACGNECWIGNEVPIYCHKCGAMFKKTIAEELQEHRSIDEFNAIMEGTIHDTRTQS